MPSTESPEAAPHFSPAYRAWMLGLLMAAYACGFIDRIIVAVIGQAIIRDLRLSDLQFGMLGGLAFALFFSALSIPVARLAERRSRIAIISISIAVWSVMTVLCGTARSYGQLLLFRLGVGLGEAGSVPPAHSLISDHYPPNKRASALAVYSIGVPVGAVVGSVAGGWLAESFGWRTALVAVGAPGLLIAFLVRVTLHEPRRGAFDRRAVPDAPPPLSATVRWLVACPTFRHMCAGCAVTTLAANGINLFAPLYFGRSFGMSLSEVGLVYGLIIGGAGTAGILAGGFGADLAARRDVRWYGWMPAIGVALAFPLYAWAYSQPAAAPALTMILLGGLSVSVYFAPTFAVMQNLVAPRMRASVSALVLVTMNVVGQGLGPLLMGFMSDFGAGRAFVGGDYHSLCIGAGRVAAFEAACATASLTGLRQSILLTTLCFVWGAAHYAIAARSIAQDLRAVPA